MPPATNIGRQSHGHAWHGPRAAQGQCTTEPESEESIHKSSNHGPNSPGGCANPDNGLKRSRLFRRSEHDHPTTLQPGFFQKSDHPLEKRQSDPSQRGKVCNYVWLGLIKTGLDYGNACESLDLMVESGKDLLLTWAFEYAVQKITLWRADIEGGIQSALDITSRQRRICWTGRAA